ncbi:MAG: hypothetical protein RMZ43_018255 [Nostoc sp. CmiVER01]|uniref:hypothetical protein n=1 Tax=Nostoc sp. CmiVER01 TaxID=3075384 RepID=UPI003D1618D8
MTTEPSKRSDRGKTPFAILTAHSKLLILTIRPSDINLFKQIDQQGRDWLIPRCGDVPAPFLVLDKVSHTVTPNNLLCADINSFFAKLGGTE